MRNFLLILLALFFIQQSVASLSIVISDSMEDTLFVGDTVLVSRTAYGFRLPFTAHPIAFAKPVARGDIVLAANPHEGPDLVKRCVAVGGQTVELRKKTLSVDGVAEIPPPGLKHADPDTIQFKDYGKKRDTMPVRTIPADSLFFMGDNRDYSLDSRVLGSLPETGVIGRVGLILWSIDPEVSWATPWKKFRSGRWFKRIN